jgi:ribosomal protein S18 acetylase RimI-like enzyme
MHIRQLTADDAAMFYPFRLLSLRESPHAFLRSYEEYSRETLDNVAQRFRQQAVANIDFTLGAFEDDQLVGIVGFYRENALKVRHKGYLVSMYVRPEDRRRGVGRALLLAALERIRRLPDLDHVLLGVMETQTAAKCLYESLGFTVYGREPRGGRPLRE